MVPVTKPRPKRRFPGKAPAGAVVSAQEQRAAAGLGIRRSGPDRVSRIQPVQVRYMPMAGFRLGVWLLPLQHLPPRAVLARSQPGKRDLYLHGHRFRYFQRFECLQITAEQFPQDFRGHGCAARNFARFPLVGKHVFRRSRGRYGQVAVSVGCRHIQIKTYRIPQHGQGAVP